MVLHSAEEKNSANRLPVQKAEMTMMVEMMILELVVEASN